MYEGALVLLIVAIAGLVGGNELVAIAAAGILGLRLIAPEAVFTWAEQHSMQAGIVLMTFGLLFPFATGRVGVSAIAESLLTPAGVVAVLVGAIASYLGLEGLNLLVIKPQVMVGLVVGSILGVSLLGGIPIGPLVAAGFTALLFRLLKV